MKFNIKNFCGDYTSKDVLRKPFYNEDKTALYAAKSCMCIKIPIKSDIFKPDLGQPEHNVVEKIEKLFSRWENIGDYQIITEFNSNNEIKNCPVCNGSGKQNCECEFCKGHECYYCNGKGHVPEKNYIGLGKWKRRFNPEFIKQILNLPNVKIFDTVHPDNLNMPYLDPIYFSFGPESECKGLLMGMRP